MQDSSLLTVSSERRRLQPLLHSTLHWLEFGRSGGFCSMTNFFLSPRPRLLTLLFVLALSLCARAASPKFHVLHAFAGGASDGAAPTSKLVLDQYGDLFGTTAGGGSLTECFSGGCGTAFELSPRNGRWKENVLFDFSPSSNGGYPNPSGPAVFDSKGNVYGTESSGGDSVGAVYQLTHSGSDWTQNILHDFVAGTSDGIYPYWGLVRDAAGNLYGATEGGGS